MANSWLDQIESRVAIVAVDDRFSANSPTSVDLSAAIAGATAAPLPGAMVSFLQEQSETAINLRQLKYFARVVEAGNMTRAAEQLFVAQPASYCRPQRPAQSI
ncbi:nitrogen assimilation transcriptional regulator [compost metagenome]